MPIPPPDGASPAMAQWFAAKAAHPDALVFFRMGDFYEMFFADAEAAATALDIALTYRGEHGGQPIPMCGVPAHAAEAYLPRLIRRGFRVAVAEQMEPAQRNARAPIRREVVRLITPGTLTEESLLEAGRSNLLVALCAAEGAIGAAALDVSTGLFETELVGPEALPALLARLDPAEIVADEDIPLGEHAARRAAPVPAAGEPGLRLAAAFDLAHVEALGELAAAEIAAAATALDYVRATQAGSLPRIARPVAGGRVGRLAMDAATRASLELVRARDGGTAHTLLGAVGRTQTAAGARLLAAWLAAPLTDLAAITARQDGWSWLVADAALAGGLRQGLRGLPDIARALARVAIGRHAPRDLAALRDGLAAAERLAGLLEGPLPALLAGAGAALRPDRGLVELLARGLAAELPARSGEPGVIAAGFDPELDAERRLRDNSRAALAGLQRDLAQRYGVASLKIRHHAQLGYVLEAPAVAVEGLRRHPELTLRQGMANGARFSLPELGELDRRIAEAAERAAARERGVVAHLTAAIVARADALAACAEALALLDVLSGCARLAAPGDWVRPEISDDDAFLIEAGRHPVVAGASQAAFVPNDCDLSAGRRVLLLTGPNMAGKSTFLRQNALMVVLAQAGLPVPARRARIGIVDRLFSRVGAADDLARGRSTFMVEMVETAAILNQAGPRSLVVVDEIGRGTATLDGLAIAWAVLEALHGQLRCRTIFATHFHELARLRHELSRLAPHTMRVKEWKGEVVFLHEVAEGAAGRSWGVHVARLAGVPSATVKRAGALLALLEKRGAALTEAAELPLFAQLEPPPAAVPDPLYQAVAEIDCDRLSPREALAALYRLQGLVGQPVAVHDADDTLGSGGC